MCPGRLTIVRTQSCRTEICRRHGKFPGFTKAPAQEFPWIHEGNGTGISLDSQRRQVRESIFPAKRRLGRVLQDCDLINVNVRAEHLFFGYSVLQDILLQDILLQDILLQVGPPVIAHRIGNGRERVGEPD